MFERRSILVLVLGMLASTPVAGESPGLGEPMTDEELAEVSLTVLPNGDGLPPGSGDARAGADLYARHCAACHGAEGEGSLNDRLVGGVGTIGTEAPVRSVGSYWPYATTIFDYVRRAMPYNAPGSLGDDEVYSLTAFLLHANGVIDEDVVIDRQSLPRVEMPNREGFFHSFGTGD